LIADILEISEKSCWYQCNVFFKAFLQWGVVSRKPQVGHGLRAPCQGKVTTIAKSKKRSKAQPKLGESVSEALLNKDWLHQMGDLERSSVNRECGRSHAKVVFSS
jgi:hypothetical protein